MAVFSDWTDFPPAILLLFLLFDDFVRTLSLMYRRRSYEKKKHRRTKNKQTNNNANTQKDKES